MPLVELFSYAAIFGTLTGFSLRDVVNARSSRDRLDRITRRSVSLRQLLAALEEPDDPLVGYWQLAHWQVPSNSTSVAGRLVSGGLAIHFRERHAPCWHGSMCLSYYTRLGWWHTNPHRSLGEPPFAAVYQVRFRATDSGYSGTSHMLDKVYYHRVHRLKARLFPGPAYKYTGDFSQCVVDGNDSTRVFRGIFQNVPQSGERGECSFAFHVPLKWGMVDDNLLSA
jgi:hypothetical protein